MGRGKDITAYSHLKEYFDRAFVYPYRVVLSFEDTNSRNQVLYDLWTFVAKDREQNKILYPDPGHIMHGASIYSAFVCRKSGTHKVIIEKRANSLEKVRWQTVDDEGNTIEEGTGQPPGLADSKSEH